MLSMSSKMLDVSERTSKQRALLILGVLTFMACYQWLYIHWAYPIFGYLGYDYIPPSTGYLVIAWMLSALPSLWMPLSIDRPSKLIYWVLYLTVFIPSVTISLFANTDTSAEATKLMLTLFIGFAVVGLSYRWRLLKFSPSRVSSSRFWYGFTLAAGALAAWALVFFWGKLHIVSFSDIYDLRFSADDVIADTLLNYPLMLLPGAINPFLMAWGLYHKKRWLFLLGALGQILVYSCVGTKGSVTSILFIPVIYLLLRGDRSKFALKLTWSVVALFVGLMLSFIVAGEQSGPFLAIVLFVVFLRTFATNGLATLLYHSFFQMNPHTYFSHAKGFSWFIHYPYANPLGIEIGIYNMGDPTLDYSAHFWATDGLGGFGLPGILLISVFCAFIFWVLDSVAKNHDPRLAALVITYSAYNIANGSLFTTLLSGGLGLLMVILYFMPREVSEDSRKSVISPAVVPAG
jgi:hypothetical protein